MDCTCLAVSEVIGLPTAVFPISGKTLSHFYCQRLLSTETASSQTAVPGGTGFLHTPAAPGFPHLSWSGWQRFQLIPVIWLRYFLLRSPSPSGAGLSTHGGCHLEAESGNTDPAYADRHCKGCHRKPEPSSEAPDHLRSLEVSPGSAR